jgi:hypothetical protein
MARDGHGLPKVSLGLAIPYPSMPCGVARPQSGRPLADFYPFGHRPPMLISHIVLLIVESAKSGSDEVQIRGNEKTDGESAATNRPGEIRAGEGAGLAGGRSQKGYANRFFVGLKLVICRETWIKTQMIRGCV